MDANSGGEKQTDKHGNKWSRRSEKYQAPPPILDGKLITGIRTGWYNSLSFFATPFAQTCKTFHGRTHDVKHKMRSFHGEKEKEQKAENIFRQFHRQLLKQTYAVIGSKNSKLRSESPPIKNKSVFQFRVRSQLYNYSNGRKKKKQQQRNKLHFSNNCLFCDSIDAN